jgi:hypothetical protein
MLIFDERLKPSFFGNIAWRGPRTIFVGRGRRVERWLNPKAKG